MSAGKDFTLCRTGRGLAASRRPFGDARFPVRHSAARAEVPPCHQTTQLNNEVSTLSGDLTWGEFEKRVRARERNFPLSNSNSRLQLIPGLARCGYYSENAVSKSSAKS